MHKKVVLITGGSRGIGSATALQAAASGWDVVISFNANQEAADAVVAQITDMGRHAMAVHADMASEEQIRRLFAVVDAQFGQLNAFVNNAGIVDSATTVAELTGERLERMFRINSIGAFLCAREAVLRMSTARGGQGGAIVNVSSIAARLGAPRQYVDYAAVLTQRFLHRSGR